MTPWGDRPPGAPDLVLDGDLDIEVDGTPVRVQASGAEISVTAHDLGHLFGSVRVAGRAATGGPLGRHQLAWVADTLARRGLTAHIDTPSGRLLTLGADVDSPVSAAAIGTRHARLHTGAGLRGLRGQIGAARLVAAAVVAVGAAGLVVRRRRR